MSALYDCLRTVEVLLLLHEGGLRFLTSPAWQALVVAGADINATNDAGRTPLQIARQEGHGRLSSWIEASSALL